MGEIGTLRQRLLCLYRMIIEQTDEAHPLPLSEIIARLGAEGIPAERKALWTCVQVGFSLHEDEQYAAVNFYAGANADVVEAFVKHWCVLLE